MNVVDSCGWLEYFADGSNAGFFAPALEDTESLIV
ncbi:MAG: VapC toxin family PIN domain ribonuclease, partial [Pseudomonadota bacterium]